MLQKILSSVWCTIIIHGWRRVTLCSLRLLLAACIALTLESCWKILVNVLDCFWMKNNTYMDWLYFPPICSPSTVWLITWYVTSVNEYKHWSNSSLKHSSAYMFVIAYDSLTFKTIIPRCCADMLCKLSNWNVSILHSGIPMLPTTNHNHNTVIYNAPPYKNYIRQKK